MIQILRVDENISIKVRYKSTQVGRRISKPMLIAQEVHLIIQKKNLTLDLVPILKSMGLNHRLVKVLKEES